MSALPSIDGSVTEWTNDMFSPELQAAIRDIVPVTDRDFDKHDFNPVAYINDNFSNEQSLTRLDNFMNRLKLKIIKIDEEIIQEVRLQSISGGKGKEDLENAKRSINELLTKITDIKSKANQSEQMVTEICKDIKSLDYAKKNLTTAITTLKRLHMMVMGVEQLKEMVDKKQYGTVAKLLEATAQFAEGFKDYRESPKIYALNKELDNIRSRVKDQIYEDFNQYVPYTSNQIKPNEENRWKSSCYVIDALGSEVKKDFLRWFCGSQLSSYKKAFGNQSENYTLDSTDRRFGWWSRQIKTFREEYALVFPPEWCMEEQISYEFCILTRLDLSEVLLINKNSIEVPQLIKALKKTLNFENKLYELFAQNNQKLSSPTMSSTPSNESENNSDDSDGDGSGEENGDNEGNGNGNGGGNSEDAIRRRWEARVEKDRKREEEKLQQQQQQLQQQQGKEVNKQPIEIPKSYERFRGIISSSFDPYMDLYINEEDKLVGEVLEKVMAEEKWTLSDEEANKILTSCTDLVFHFIKVRNRCAELTKGEPFFNLYHLFRKYLTQYANIISGKIHTDVGRAHDAQEDKTICLIINTAEFCRKTSGQMTDGFKKIIDEKYKELIDLKDIQNDFSSIIAKGVKALVSGIEAKLDPHLQSMTRMEWGERYQYVGDNSPYVNEVVQIISESSQLEVAWLSPEHFRYFCDLFASSFGLRIPQSIYKCRGISEIGSQGILLDITTIKTVLLDLPNKVKDGRSNSRYTKLLNKEFAKAENLLKVIGCSQDHLVETFKDLFPDSTNADFQKIMDLKGYKVGDKIQTELFEKLSKVSTNIGASIKTKFFN